MKIIRIYPFLPPQSGGMEKHVARLTEEQRKIGYEIAVVFSEGNPTDKKDIHISIPFEIRGLRPQLFRDSLFYLCVIFVLFFRKETAQAIHIHGDWSAMLWGRLIRWLCKSDVLVGSFHDKIQRRRKLLYRFILSAFSKVYCTGKSDVIYLNAIGVKNVEWQSSGIDKEFIEANFDCGRERNIDVISVGNLYAKKNTRLILDIAKNLNALKFVVVGSGPEMGFLKKYKDENLIHNVEFCENADRGSVVDLLSRAKIFLSTSLFEGTPTAMLEAMAMGVPVITSESNDYSGIIDNGLNGFVINSYRAEDYVKAIEFLIGNKEARNSFSAKSVRKSADYAWPSVAARISKFFVLSGVTKIV